MREYLGVITWNVNGDLVGHQTAVQRRQNLQDVLKKLGEEQDCPVDLICLQETSGEQSGLMAALKKKEYTCQTLTEGKRGGRSYVFALSPGSGLTFKEDPQQCCIHYQSPTGSPLRYPAMARLVRQEDMMQVTVFNFHAPLGGALVEGLCRCSQFAEAAAKEAAEAAAREENAHYVLVAGDLNINKQKMETDPDLIRYVNLLRQLFRGFAGVSYELDHVLCAPDRGLRKLKGYNFETSSDHHLIYCRIKLT